jgi:hypothetical protein
VVKRLRIEHLNKHDTDRIVKEGQYNHRHIVPILAYCVEAVKRKKGDDPADLLIATLYPFGLPLMEEIRRWNETQERDCRYLEDLGHCFRHICASIAYFHKKGEPLGNINAKSFFFHYSSGQAGDRVTRLLPFLAKAVSRNERVPSTAEDVHPAGQLFYECIMGKEVGETSNKATSLADFKTRLPSVDDVVLEELATIISSCMSCDQRWNILQTYHAFGTLCDTLKIVAPPGSAEISSPVTDGDKHAAENPLPDLDPTSMYHARNNIDDANTIAEQKLDDDDVSGSRSILVAKAQENQQFDAEDNLRSEPDLESQGAFQSDDLIASNEAAASMLEQEPKDEPNSPSDSIEPNDAAGWFLEEEPKFDQ